MIKFQLHPETGLSTEHSENKIVTLFGLFENEIGPGEQQLTVQNSMYDARKPKAPGPGHCKCFDSALLSGILTGYMFVERWTRSLQIQPRFRKFAIILPSESSTVFVF